MKSVTSNKIHTVKGLFLFALAVGLSSCGSQQNSGYYDQDGVYGTANTTSVAPTQEVSDTDKSSYYKQYFNSKNAEIGQISDEGSVFTDIDTYTTQDSLDTQGYIVIVDDQQESYGAWGTNGGEVVVNVYDSVGFGWAQPFWWYGGYGGWGWGYGFNPAWNYWAWSPGFGWGWGYGWGVPYYGFNAGFCGYRPYYNNYYVNGVAYNRGRRVTSRDAYAANSRLNTRGASARNGSRARSGTYSRTEVARRINSNNARRTSGYSRSSSAMNSSRSNGYSRNTRSQSRSNTNSMYNNRSSRSNSYNRSSRSNSGMRSSGSRSSGSRSSGMRSSGGSRGGGGMSRGGGGSRGGRGGRG